VNNVRKGITVEVLTKRRLVFMSQPTHLEARIGVLEDIEAIKKLKAKYWYYVDGKLWNELETCFVEDAAADYGPTIELHGRKAIMQYLKDTLGADTIVTFHEGHNPDIEITSDRTARGIWTLHDYAVMQPGRTMSGWGHYEDEYVKQDGKWMKKSTKITRILEEWTMTKR
jgi:hypothetical protein